MVCSGILWSTAYNDGSGILAADISPPALRLMPVLFTA